MRISDWSSDVCSSDLYSDRFLHDRLSRRDSGNSRHALRPFCLSRRTLQPHALGREILPVPHLCKHLHELQLSFDRPVALLLPRQQIERAPCWERVFKNVSISVGAVSYKKKKRK